MSCHRALLCSPARHHTSPVPVAAPLLPSPSSSCPKSHSPSAHFEAIPGLPQDRGSALPLPRSPHPGALPANTPNRAPRPRVSRPFGKYQKGAGLLNMHACELFSLAKLPAEGRRLGIAGILKQPRSSQRFSSSARNTFRV